MKIWRISVRNTSGHGLLSLSNKSGKGLVAMFADETSGGLELSNKDDKRIAFLGTDIGGEGLLKINSKTGTELITGRLKPRRQWTDQGKQSLWHSGGLRREY